MNHFVLYAKCATLINKLGKGACITLVVPRYSTGNTIRLAGKLGGPSGHILNERDGCTAAMFKCNAVIRWLKKILLPTKCFICDKPDCGVIPWVLDVAEREEPSAVFTCKDCPSMADHLKNEYGATISSTSEAINRKTKHYNIYYLP